MSLNKQDKEFISASLYFYVREHYYRSADSGDNDHYFHKLKEVDQIVTKLKKVK